MELLDGHLQEEGELLTHFANLYINHVRSRSRSQSPRHRRRR